jgi:translation initiation factor IF-2
MTKKKTATETVRIYDLSKELKVTNKEVMDVLDSNKIAYKSVSSNISTADAEVVKKAFGKKSTTKSATKTETKEPAKAAAKKSPVKPLKKPAKETKPVDETITLNIVHHTKQERVVIKAGSTVAQVERDLGLGAGKLIGQDKTLKPNDVFDKDTTVFVATSKRNG